MAADDRRDPRATAGGLVFAGQGNGQFKAHDAAVAVDCRALHDGLRHAKRQPAFGGPGEMPVALQRSIALRTVRSAQQTAW
jgi:hypothetical protein